MPRPGRFAAACAPRRTARDPQEQRAMQNKKLMGNLMLLIMAAIWGSAFVAQRMAAGSELGPLAFCAVRYLLAAVLMIPVIAVSQKRSGRRGVNPFDAKSYGGGKESGWMTGYALGERRRKTVLGGLLAGVFMFGGTASQQIGLITVTSGKAAFLTALYVILVPLGALVVFRKKPGVLAWVGALLGLVGLYFLSFAGGASAGGLFGSVSTGDLLVLLCAAFWAAQILTVDRFMSENADPVRVAGLEYAVTGLLALIAMLLFERPTWAAVLANAGPILYTAVLSTVVGFTLQIIAQQYTDPTPAALIMSLESVFGALTGALILREFLSGRELIGSAVLFAGVIVSQLTPKPREGGRRDRRREKL
jgi:drug/metabolite transporter (DMT)-like permease